MSDTEAETPRKTMRFSTLDGSSPLNATTELRKKEIELGLREQCLDEKEKASAAKEKYYHGLQADIILKNEDLLEREGKITKVEQDLEVKSVDLQNKEDNLKLQDEFLTGQMKELKIKENELKKENEHLKQRESELKTREIALQNNENLPSSLKPAKNPKLMQKNIDGLAIHVGSWVLVKTWQQWLQLDGWKLFASAATRELFPSLVAKYNSEKVAKDKLLVHVRVLVKLYLASLKKEPFDPSDEDTFNRATCPKAYDECKKLLFKKSPSVQNALERYVSEVLRKFDVPEDEEEEEDKEDE